jgi:hypothetical protein
MGKSPVILVPPISPNDTRCASSKRGHIEAPRLSAISSPRNRLEQPDIGTISPSAGQGPPDWPFLINKSCSLQNGISATPVPGKPLKGLTYPRSTARTRRREARMGLWIQQPVNRRGHRQNSGQNRSRVHRVRLIISHAATQMRPERRSAGRMKGGTQSPFSSILAERGKSQGLGDSVPKISAVTALSGCARINPEKM